jgi:hypothetical protein
VCGIKNITPANPFGFSKKNILAPIGNEYSPATGFKKESPAAATPETVPGAVPPTSPNSAEVTQAQQDFLRQEMLKKSIKRTIFAGDTGGYTPARAPVPAK